MKSSILHVDMDAFFAAVEQRDDPLLKGRPVIVGGGDPTQRGVVSAASYEARAFGVCSAMPLGEAFRLCPEGVFLPGDHRKYGRISQEFLSILHSFTPLVEKVSIDEAFLDVRGCEGLFGSSCTIARHIKKAIKRELDLTVSVGVAPNKLLAKVASDLEKPDGLVFVGPDEGERFLEQLPIARLWGVGKKTEDILNQKGIGTIGQLRAVNPLLLKAWFGKAGMELHSRARGLDHHLVNPAPPLEKSMGHEITFSTDLVEERQLSGALLELTARVSRRLRKGKMKGRTLTLKVRFSDFTTITRRITLQEPTCSETRIYQEALRLFQSVFKDGSAFRLLGISMSNLVEISREQLSLFQDPFPGEEDLMTVVDHLRDRFGEGIIKKGGTFFLKE